ncbi:TPA: hypothetical protein L4T12_004932 [Pseudomonas aeruginosa]|nr:hypothetical protein [Pseudomonas aeruginosa]
MPNNQYRPPERHEIAGIQYIGAVLQQADRYAETKCAKDRDVLRELAIDLVAKAAG